jgi:outer membrane protein assembly factor BamD (BamD/ComL family)
MFLSIIHCPRQSSTGYGRVQEMYTEGERAYFKGDYAEAVKKLNIADRIVREMPNDYSAELESSRSATVPAEPPAGHPAP